MIGEIEYFRRLKGPYRELFEPGQIFLAPVTFALADNPSRVLLEHDDRQNPRNNLYSVVPTDLSRYNANDDPPLRALNMKSGEFLLAVPHKLRPTILLSNQIIHSAAIGGTDGFVLLPMYSLRDESGNYKTAVTEEFLIKLQGYQYNSLFYVPEDADVGLAEGYVRLDRPQFCRGRHLRHMPVALTTDALYILRQWFWHYFGGPLDEVVTDLIDRATKAVNARLAGDR